MAQKLEVDDFSGGVTDYYLYAPPNKMKTCDNMLIAVYPGIGKPFTRPGSQFFDSNYEQIPAGAQRISTAFNYKNLLHLQSSQKLYYYSAASGWNTVNGPTGNNAFLGASTTSYFTYGHWNYHTLITHSDLEFPKKIYINQSGVPVVTEAGLPQIASSGVTIAAAAGANSWLYKVLYRHDYTVYGDLQFSDFAAPSLAKGTTPAAAALPVTITIPTLSNGVASNFRTANITIEVYRTTNNGDVFYKVGEIANNPAVPTVAFVDNVSDAVLADNEPLYTTGGVLENDRPPRCKVVHVMNDVAYYANVKDSANQKLDFRVYQSIPEDIDSVPLQNYVDVDDEIITVSSTKSNAVILCRNSIHRIDGFYDETGQGVVTTEKISDTCGCIGPQTAVQALDGVFWMGQDGVYFTDGFKVMKLNQDYDKTYRTFVTTSGAINDTKNFKFQGKYDKKKNRIWWAIQKADTGGSPEVDGCYVLDLNWGIKENATFTTVSGASFAPTAIEFINGEMVRCDKRGYVFIHRDGLFSDPKIDLTVAPENWVPETIIYELESIAYNFGTTATRKYVTQVNLTADSTTNLSLKIVSNNDDNRKIADILPIRYRGNIIWGEPDVYWGDITLEWNKEGLISEKRRMPAKNLRCNYKSIKLTNAQVAIINSDIIGNANVDSTFKTVTLVNAGSYDWPSYSVDYKIAFETDDYTREFLITARTADILSFEDAANASQTANNVKWVIRGYPKDEILNLLNLSIIYEVSGPTLNVYRTADSGEVGA